MKHFLRENTWIGGTEKGWGNGYVALPRQHPLFGMDTIEINEKVGDVFVHGGVTWARNSDHIVGWKEVQDMDDMWVIGWDTAHFGDDMANYPKERVLKENIGFAIALAQIWSVDIKKQSNDLELFVNEIRETLFNI